MFVTRNPCQAGDKAPPSVLLVEELRGGGSTGSKGVHQTLADLSQLPPDLIALIEQYCAAAPVAGGPVGKGNGKNGGGPEVRATGGAAFPPEPARGISGALRNRAEAVLRGTSAAGAAAALPLPEAVEHELRVHQIELELQNEELRRTLAELEVSRQRYFDLYELAPVGYLTLDPAGKILEVNLTAASLLGLPRTAVVGRKLTSVIFSEDQDAFYLQREHLEKAGEPLTCELRMVKRDGSTFWAQLRVSITRDARGGSASRCVFSDVTEYKQVLEKLQDSEALLNATQLLSKVGGWVLDVAQGRIHWTEGTYRIHGYAPGEVGSSLDEHHIKSLQLCDEADRPAILAAFLRCAEHGVPYDIEYGFTTAGGERRWLRTCAQATWDGPRVAKVVGNIIDITEHKQAQLALEEWNTTLEQRVSERTRERQESEARFRQLADATFEGIAVTDDGILIDANSRFAAMHGYDLAEMIGRPVSEFVAPQARRSAAKGFTHARERNHELLGLRKDGSVFPVEARARIGPWLGHTMRIITLRDLSEAKAAEARLHALRSELVRAQRLALVSEVSAGIIHQLSQPLSSVSMNLTVLLKLKAVELQQCGATEILDEISADFARMRGIVTRLRAIANPEQVKRASCNINDLAAEVLPLLKARADHAEVRVELDLDEHLPAIHADAIQLSQVVFNLARNAIEASASVPPERRTVLISTRPHAGNSVELCVSDHGCGLPADAAAHLFTPFFTTKSDGMGVGLRLCQTIIRAHDGQIEGFNNTDGPGATFRIKLPVDPPPLSAPAAS